jgi:hypothetical protein
MPGCKLNKMMVPNANHMKMFRMIKPYVTVTESGRWFMLTPFEPS